MWRPYLPSHLCLSSSNETVCQIFKKFGTGETKGVEQTSILLQSTQ